MKLYYYTLFFIMIVIFLYCKYRIYLIKKKYTNNGRSYFEINLKNLKVEDKELVDVWRMIAFMLPILFVLLSFIGGIIAKAKR